MLHLFCYKNKSPACLVKYQENCPFGKIEIKK